MPTVTLEAKRLTKRYGARAAVDGLSFVAHQGNVVGLLGPNGAGKTTTIRLLSTMLTPSTGEFSVAGVPSNRPAEIRRRIGVLPESAGYPANQTGREYLRYHARLFGLTRAEAERVATRLLAEVGLDGRTESRIASYSRGMRQRLGIARALINDPAVVFLDEPTLGLDPAGQRRVLGTVRTIAERGATVVLSTHTLPEVEEICTSVLILDRGRVVAASSVGDVTAAAVARRTARLRVPAVCVGQVREALAGLAGLRLDAVDDDAGALRVSLGADSDGSCDGIPTELNDALRAVLRMDVPVLSFEVDGARLSDAFLTMTREGAR